LPSTPTSGPQPPLTNISSPLNVPGLDYSKSPTLSQSIRDLQRDGWTIAWNPDPRSPETSTSMNSKTIWISQTARGNPALVWQYLAHEVGHATDSMPQTINDPAWRYASQSLQGNEDQELKGEVNAQFFNAKIRQEILGNGGPDIGINGSDAALATYNLYSNGHISLDQARTLLIEDWRSSRPSDGKYATYGEKYREAAESRDRTREPEPPSSPPPHTEGVPSPAPAPVTPGHG
jgi:hypothetical protein